MTVSREQFWQFSLDVYQQQQLQDKLLTLQNQHGINVNLTLLCLFLNSKGLYLQTKQFEQLHQQLTTFNHTFTESLRQLRSSFKIKQRQLEQYAALRKHLLAAELLLEQQEQGILIAHLPVDFTLVQGDNLALYQAFLAKLNTAQDIPTLKLSDLNQYIL